MTGQGLHQDHTSQDSTQNKTFRIWCDGSYNVDYRVGAWGAVIVHPNGTEYEYSGITPQCTINQESEIWSIISALRVIPDKAVVSILNDCADVVYVIRTILGTERPKRKKAHRWLKNQTDFVTLIRAEVNRLERMDIHWVRGHNADLMNRRSDRLARNAMRSSVGSLKKQVTANVEPLKNRLKEFNGNHYPHWRTYIGAVGSVLSRGKYLLQTGDARRITQRLCCAGYLTASSPYGSRESKGIPGAHIIYSVAEWFGIGKRTQA